MISSSRYAKINNGKLLKVENVENVHVFEMSVDQHWRVSFITECGYLSTDTGYSTT